MSKNLSHKKRFYLLFTGLVLLLWLSYTFAFSRTIQLKKLYNERVDQLSRVQNAPEKLALINSKLKQIENLIGEVNSETSPHLIKTTGEYCKKNGVLLFEIPPKHVSEKDGFAIITYRIILKGDFKNLLNFLLELETNFDIGKVRAVAFNSEHNYTTDKKELYGTFFIQSVGKTNE